MQNMPCRKYVKKKTLRNLTALGWLGMMLEDLPKALLLNFTVVS